MNLNTIVAHAAVNSGVVASFNIPEIPADVQAIAREALEEELLPQMNADRTLDVTVLSKVYQPINNRIILTASEDMPWVPARIDAIFEEPSGLPYQYLYMEEFESIDYKFQPYVYTFILDETGMTLIFRLNNGPKKLIYPVPIYIKGDEIIAPPKFKQYLIDALATRLATIYGTSVLPTVYQMAQVSYNTLLKQQPVPLHGVNPRLKIRDVMKNGQSRYWRFDGFV